MGVIPRKRTTKKLARPASQALQNGFGFVAAAHAYRRDIRPVVDYLRDQPKTRIAIGAHVDHDDVGLHPPDAFAQLVARRILSEMRNDRKPIETLERGRNLLSQILVWADQNRRETLRRAWCQIVHALVLAVAAEPA